MSTQAPQPAPESQEPATGRQPTQEDILAIAQAASQGLEEVRTEQEATRKIAEQAQAEATKRGVDVPEPVIKQISEQTAQAVIGQLRAIGALRDDPVPPTDAGTPTGGEDGKDSGTSGESAAGSEPRRKTVAERYLGL